MARAGGPKSGRTARGAHAAVLAAVLALGGAATASAQTSATATAMPSSTAAAVAAGDALYGIRDFEGALKAYEGGAVTDSASYELWWRIARSLTDRGARAEYDKNRSRAEASFDAAVRAGRRATGLNPDGWEGHMELCVALGRLALFRGGKEKIRISKDVKAEADRTLALNDRADRAHHVLGRWNREIVELNFFMKAAAKIIYGGVPKGASMENAIAHFERAVELNPNYVNHRLQLGITYLDAGLKMKAREQFQKALTLPIATPFDAEYKDEAVRRLQKTEK